MKAKHWFAIVFGIMLVGFAIWGFNSKIFNSDNDESSISAIVIFGFGLTATIFAVLVIVFSFFDLNDKTQALGLPEGSIRALLAFSLVLIFVLLATYLYGRVDDVLCQNCGKDLSGVTQAQIDNLKKDGFIVIAEPAVDKDGKQVYQQIPVQNGQPQDPSTQIPSARNGSTAKASTENRSTQNDSNRPLFKVTYYPKGNPAAADFAKQIFTTMATVFVSVVSFYFGSSVTSSAVKIAQTNLGPLRTALTAALADSHNAQVAVDQAKVKLQKAQQEATTDPSKQNAVVTAQKELDAANADLLQKQAKVQQAQKALNDAQGISSTPSTSTPAGSPSPTS